MKDKKILFTICFFSSMFGGTVSTLMAVYLPVAVKDLLVHPSAAEFDNISASISAVFIFGWMAGGIIWGILCDKMGRKRSFIYATACYGLFTLVTALAPVWWLVVISRFLSGFGIGGVLVITTLLISEGYPEGKRAVYLGILSISIPVGIFSAGLINYLLPYWRYAFTIGVIPLLLAALGTLFFTESEAWAKGRELARKATGKTQGMGRPAGSGGQETMGALAAGSNLSVLFSRHHRHNLVVGSLIFGAALIGLWATFSWLPSWIQGLVTASDGQKERGVAMMLMGGGGLVGGFVSGWIVNAFNVKRTLLVFFAISFILSFFLFKLSAQLSFIVYLQIAVISFFFGVSQGALSVYIPDLFPPSVRATGTGFCFNVGRFVTGVAVFFIGSLVDFLGGYGNAIFWFSFVFLAGLLITLFTKTTSPSSVAAIPVPEVSIVQS
ncbi:MAG TPA: MFS transporter [Puia sp.]|nr:MFS transporter [Puia sp.]